MPHALTNPRIAVAALAASAISLGVTACGTERHAASPGARPAPPSARVSIKGYAFAPATVRVKAGGTIIFRNLDPTAHTATASDNRSFDSGTIKASGKTATVRFTRAGRFTYYCAFHPYMHGTVIVTP